MVLAARTLNVWSVPPSGAWPDTGGDGTSRLRCMLATLDAQKARQLEADVRELYLTDYVRHWETLLADLDVVGLTSLRQGVLYAAAAPGLWRPAAAPALL